MLRPLAPPRSWLRRWFGPKPKATYLGQNRLLIRLFMADQVLNCLVEADDLLFTPHLINTGLFEEGITRYLATMLRPQDHCLDIGANFGYYTMLFGLACPKGRVIGVEPQPELVQLGRANLAMNRLLGHASLLQAAICEAARPVTMHRRRTRSGNTSMTPPAADFLAMMGEPAGEAFPVPGLPLDAMLDRFEGRLDVIKIDVEGAEPLVFAGAGRCIASNPGLQILMEWSPGQIRAAGFDVGDFLHGLAARKLRFFTLGTRRPREVSVAELLTIPYRPGILVTREPR